MQEKIEFPFGLESYRGNPPSEPQTLKFQNYFPSSSVLKETCEIIPIATDCSLIERQTL
jgi:hypothetical protein